MSLKQQITGVLKTQGHTYTQLADYIGLSEADLDFALENKSIDIRTLELISKALHISLYSFFRDNQVKKTESPYYHLDLWSTQDNPYKAEINTLKKQMEDLKILLKEKEDLISKLQGK
jgi:transcriptional regulator with XRE-family HTH domain